MTAHQNEGGDKLPDPYPDWNPGDIIRYLEAMFDPDDHVGIVATAWQDKDSGAWLPQKGYVTGHELSWGWHYLDKCDCWNGTDSSKSGR